MALLDPLPRHEVDFQSLLVGGSADLNAVTTTDGVYCYVSSACERLFGWLARDLVGQRYEDFVNADDVPPQCPAQCDSDEAMVMNTHRFLCKDGSYRWVESTSRPAQAGGEHFVVIGVRDISERKALDVALQIQALTDPLTGVANRTVLMDRLRQGLRRQARGSGVLALMYVDLDRFKVVNDSLGHFIGDAVLLQMAERLTHYVRPADTLARLGGDEFAIVCEDVADEHAAIELGDRITRAGRIPFRVGEEEFTCTFSMGIACTADCQYSADQLLQEADLALYRAKDRGRDRAELFDENLRVTAMERLGTERMLRRAIDEERLVAEYQPIIDLRGGHVASAEALVRIRDRSGVLLQPDSFIHIAEETGLLITIDEFMLDTAIQQARAWDDVTATGSVGVAVNITARHLADAGFARGVIDSLDAHDVPHDRLEIEVTERVLMEASNSATTGLATLRSAGVRVGLDDFGTGYSSLAYLRQFPLDFIKIDKSFIHGLVRTPSERAVVAAIIELSHALGLTVVAEGVEDDSQLRLLQSLGCDRAQGFLFATPRAASLLDRYLGANGCASLL
jgi:diguanylate cyclase (GGDEF)-like protein/PAS domain S-box-containing protein